MAQDQKKSVSAEEEQRETRRNRTLLGGKIVLNHEGSVIDCLVRNKSETGCQLIVENQSGIPESFELKIPTTGERHKCTVAWRKADKMGLTFNK